MEKIEFEISEELKKAFLEHLSARGLNLNQWLEENIESYLITEIEREHMEAQLAANGELIEGQLPPPNAVSMGGFSLDQDLPSELIQKIIVESIREGFAKYGVNVDSKSFAEIEDKYNKQLN